MLSRALILATVMLSTLVAAPETNAQNLEAGKSPSQIFAGSCAVCHRSQRGLLKTVPPGSLPGFLREHYTTSRDMAQQLSAFLLSNGATDPRGAGGRLTKQGQDAKSGGPGEPPPADQQGRRQRPGQPQEAARPDADGLSSTDPRAGRTKRNRADQQPAVGPDGQPVDPAQSRQKQKMGKKKGEEAPKGSPAPVPIEAAKPDAPKPEVAPDQMPQLPEPAPVVIDPKIDAPTPEPGRPNGTASETPAMRPDPVPQVTPAQKPAEPETPRAAPVPVETPAPAAEPSSAPTLSEPPRPTISVTPPPPPAPPSGPPVPPISQ